MFSEFSSEPEHRFWFVVKILKRPWPVNAERRLTKWNRTLARGRCRAGAAISASSISGPPPPPPHLSDATNDYIYGPSGTPVEQISLATSTPTYLTYTGSNSTWISTNQAGDQTGYWGYDAYGNLAFGTPTSPFGYSGQYADATTGLVNDRARWYEPQTGGFTTRDPAFAHTDQAYAYAGGDPVNDSDPTGMCSTWQWFVSPAACIFGVFPGGSTHRPSPSSWCKPSNPPYGETFYGTDGCIAYQTDPVTGSTAIGIIMAPWTDPAGLYSYIIGINGRVWDAEYDKVSWPALHTFVPSQFAPPGSFIETLADYVTPTEIYRNVPNVYVVPDLSGVIVVSCSSSSNSGSSTSGLSL